MSDLTSSSFPCTERGCYGGCCCCGGNEIRNARYINANILAYALTK
ncbi:MAG: hypothetical protein KDA16_14465 [Phycisphaerales bacterium]|nr:hypothetical protein [Phycisphaerales bacterium]